MFVAATAAFRGIDAGCSRGGEDGRSITGHYDKPLQAAS
jgi:hypothetical protein